MSVFFKYVHPLLLLFVILASLAIYTFVEGGGPVASPLLLLLLGIFIMPGVVAGLILTASRAAKNSGSRKMKERLAHALLLMFVILAILAFYYFGMDGAGPCNPGPLILLLLAPSIMIGIVGGLILSVRQTTSRKANEPPILPKLKS